MEIKELLEELYSYSFFGIKLGLENIKKICDILGNPQDKYKIIHVSGTNGKGSTSTMIEHALLHSGKKIGKYTSPHIIKFNERIRVNGKDISDEKIAEIYSKVKNALKDSDIKPTFFEMTTAMMFLYFAEEKVEYAVLEVGMGGRFDATNIADGDISIVTNVSVEHTEYLGDNVYDIAKEKAGIIKEKSKVIVGDNDCDFLKAIYEKKPKSEVINVVEKYKDVVYKLDFKNFRTNILLESENYSLSLFGDYQVKNFLCAYEALKILNIERKIIKEAMENVLWQCRFEIYSKDPLTVLEGAHNIDGMKNLKKIVSQGYDKNQVIMVVSILKDKKINEMIEICQEMSDTIVLTSLKENKRGLLGEELLEHTNRKNLIVKEEMTEAYEYSKKVLEEDDNKKIIIVCGSFYTCEKFKNSFKF
ncbi:MAG: folylpolyglutamate synthase/dihydrofolate synthase family protein [Fusobacterium sp. JB021]|nr:folylpolyglutamate synthase/dihydrofolate synthase family protein [Fusobacterium sp. JB020]MDP0493886.1 folylpolyglutamate synthase/dihydrofolate synthase family protein [Fusobacterium sp. JB021]MDP0506145.1 folylpolyglutamate synthase/dihydrofolate synthase family protein [Fusobacterium sp. JB019]